MQGLIERFRRLLENGTPEDIEVISGLLDNLQRKQGGRYSTYLNAALEMQRDLLDDDRCIISLHNGPFIHNSAGIPHGGILATLADTAMGTLATARSPEGFVAVTVNFNIHYLSVAEEETILAEASIVRHGRHLIVAESEIRQPDGRIVATATGSFMAVPKQS